METKRVFVSYSWDNEPHKTWVRLLAERLTRNGIHTRLDIWHVPPGESLTLFMEEIRESDCVIVVCTQNYARRSTQPKGGVGYEQQIISGEILSGVQRSKFIPVLREGSFDAGPSCGLPPHFVGIRAIDFRPEATDDEAFEILLRAIYDEPKFRPPAIGRPPAFVSSRPDLNSRAQRLAVIDLDGWHLLSGIAAHERYSATFEIPNSEDINGLAAGDFVKLMFEISIFRDPSNSENYVERMWVQIDALGAPYLSGTLANQPSYLLDYEDAIEERNKRLTAAGITLHQLKIEPYLASDAETNLIEMSEKMELRYGVKVHFLPEHIISIDRRSN